MDKLIICMLLLSTLCGCNTQKNKENETEKKDSITMVGNDRDEHGCIGSAGYQWSEVRKDCIRIFEVGIRLESAEDTTQSVYLVFSPDSTQAELFFSHQERREILDQRKLPNGTSVWNVEDDDTKNIRHTAQGWTISQRGKLIYTQPVSK